MSVVESKPRRSLSSLERALGLQQLQINRLLNITQAINANVAAQELFRMYSDFLNWELGIERMALYLRVEEEWTCVAHINLSEEERKLDLSGTLSRFTSLTVISAAVKGSAMLQKFDLVIPVSHKEYPLAYVLLGSVDDTPEMYNKVQFVTTITNVIAVAIENKRLFKQQLERERYKAELAFATDIQRSLIPGKLPCTDSYSMAALYEPRFGVGGDFYSADQFEDERLLFCLADVAGKGTGAALLMSNFEASFWTLARKHADLATFVSDLNQALFRVTKGDRFVTLFVGEYTPSTHQLTYVNAGHNPPLLMRSAHSGNSEGVAELRAGCTFLGAFENLPPVEVGHCDLSGTGGMLLCYTDGVTELANETGEMYEEVRLATFVRHQMHHVNNFGEGSTAASQFNDALLNELRAFQGDAEPTDDLSVLTVCFRA